MSAGVGAQVLHGLPPCPGGGSVGSYRQRRGHSLKDLSGGRQNEAAVLFADGCPSKEAGLKGRLVCFANPDRTLRLSEGFFQLHSTKRMWEGGGGSHL